MNIFRTKPYKSWNPRLVHCELMDCACPVNFYMLCKGRWIEFLYNMVDSWSCIQPVEQRVRHPNY